MLLVERVLGGREATERGNLRPTPGHVPWDGVITLVGKAVGRQLMEIGMRVGMEGEIGRGGKG